ncbi:OPT oligopeptide transporter protein-domain-containing protein [Paraphoma chrysanthemicola]|uniref:OPT oligopeptide transporter protein-domain-containing protein n=1 Tax=Paraphoma chrysanthemicola TaxID=798071 RepID=A0A8K0W0B9_9PLEO|nr:OPT oligopeptide transporter protein-domain-containing protein [Paraphoma chrysanthemicola]
MAGDAGRLPSSLASSVGPVGDTRYSAPSSSAGSAYELHVLPEKAKNNIATSETGPDDEHRVLPHSRRNSQQEPEMSRVPLLVRSSPAQGTGSYGGVPILSVSPDDSDEHHVTKVSTRGKRKGKSKLATSVTAQTPWLPEDSNGVPSQRDTSRRFSTSSRRRRRDESGSSKTLADEFDGQEGFQFEGRFNASGLDPSTAGAPPHFDSSQTSASSTHLEDDEEDSESDDLHDTKGSPSDDSPYAQVRASVAATDNTSLSIDTPRMWFLSIIFAIAGSSTNLFFSLRYPSVSLTPIIALLLVHPLGLLWDQILKRPDDPEETFLDGCLQKTAYSSHTSQYKTSWKRQLRLWLAQGQWNEKEHCCVYVSSNVSFGFAFATDVIVEQVKFYHQDLGIIYQILLVLSTQILGYSLAGLTRRYLVRPSGMIWPATLVSTAMFTALHKEVNKPANGWTISPRKFFVRIFIGGVAFYFLPGLLFPALSSFNMITWFAPRNVVVANLFGVASGLGMFPVTFDWAQIAYIGSPLVTPFWAAMNIVGGLVVVMWFVAPLMYYMNVMYSAYMPILSAAVWDNRGKNYDVSKILTKDFLFDEAAYKDYSRVYLPITYVLSYALQFAALTALLSHTGLWHGKDIWRQWRRSWAEIRKEAATDYQPLARSTTGDDPPTSPTLYRVRSSTTSEPEMEDLLNAQDVHNRLMQRYDDVPIFWYILTGVSMAAVGMFVVEYYPVHLPWYGLLLALGIGAILFIPIGIVMAITNQQSSIYLICQLICGVMFPGRPVANMVFTTFGYISSTQGLKFASDLKLGHYMKIPPRILFKLQLSVTIISSLAQIGVLNWMLNYIPGICTPQAINGFNCPIARVHFNGSILWGVVGPKRFFGPGALYRPLVWAFLVGAISPVPIWYFARHNRRSILRKINPAVVFGSLSWIPPATGLNFSVWAIVCYIFNYEIKNRRKEWWKKYNMMLSAALDSGLAFGVVVIFFGIVYPGWMSGFKWWGTEVYKQGCDWQACPYKTLAPGETFGP